MYNIDSNPGCDISVVKEGERFKREKMN